MAIENNRYKLVSVLSGLVGALGSNEKTENTDRILLEALALFHALPDEAEAELSPENVKTIKAGVLAVRREKYTIVPGCAACQAPCKNTADFDFNQLWEAEPREREQKLRLLELAGTLADALLKRPVSETDAETIACLYQTVSFIAWESDPDYLEAMQELLESALKQEHTEGC